MTNAIIFILFLFFGSISAWASTTNLSEEEYANKVNEFISDDRWKDGISWGANQVPKLPNSGDSYSCVAYARDFINYVYGVTSFSSGDQYEGISKINDIRTGDAVYYNNGTNDHVFIVLKREGDRLYSAEGNYSGKVRIQSFGYFIENNTLYIQYPTGGTEALSFLKGIHFLDFSNRQDIKTVKVTGKKYVTDARAMLDAVNEYRTAPENALYNTDNRTTLNNLTYDYELEKAAMKRAIELAVMEDTTRPNGMANSSITRQNNTVYDEIVHCENFRSVRNDGTVDVRRILTNIVEYDGASCQHNMSALLNPNYSTIGIGSFSVNGRVYWALEFGNVNSGPLQTNDNDADVLEEVEYSTDFVDISFRYTTAVFNANGGQISESSLRKIYINSQYGELPVPSREGYDFLGWYSDSSGGTEITENTVADVIGYVYVYAHWNKQASQDPIRDTSDDNIETQDPVVEFVTRMYRVALEREPDATGLNDWVNQLKSRTKSGADIAQGFYLSPEMLNKGLSNEEYVELAYLGIMGRGSDEDGKRDWVEALQCGVTYNAIVRGFVGSQEFNSLCASYGIFAGGLRATENRDKNVGATKFVSRLYTEVLGRSFDEDGLNDWTGRINNNPSKRNILYVSTNGFLHSQEFISRGLSDEDYVYIMYRTYLGREPDQAGYNDWVSRLRNGRSRDDIASGFANSQEFANIMARYGL